MESLIEEASKELSDKLSIESETKVSMGQFQLQIDNSTKRVKEAVELNNKLQTELTANRESIHILKAKNEEMQNLFLQIDQLEAAVNQVKDTYNSVANNLDRMEKTVLTSMSNTTFGLGKKADRAIQPYFPPPGNMDIYSTDALFESISLNQSN
ncbi:hypothetical protein BY458DRAFT_506422 [Sporodiniella umbellata]|nr:hypothetical protein BY458DRAFT_506422 [Sporodiniella umbellata]